MAKRLMSVLSLDWSDNSRSAPNSFRYPALLCDPFKPTSALLHHVLTDGVAAPSASRTQVGSGRFLRGTSGTLGRVGWSGSASAAGIRNLG